MKLSAATVARVRWGWLHSDRLADWIEAHIPEPRATRWIDALGEVVDRLDRILVRRLCAHDEAIADHCGRPEHDLCRGCDKPMPGQARRGVA